MYLKQRKQPRPAAVLVETAVVMTLFCMFLFGILEYCRYLFYKDVMFNAAREGARYAVVNTNDPDVVNKTRDQTLQAMRGQDSRLGDFTFEVTHADTAGNNLGPIGDAPFGSLIQVKLEGDFQPLLPVLLLMDGPIRIRVTASMCCEAN